MLSFGIPLGGGIVGIGSIVEQHILAALSRVANTKVVAVCSRSMERAESFATKHGIEHAYDSLKKMLKDPKVDVVYIATPNSLHAQQTIQNECHPRIEPPRQSN